MAPIDAVLKVVHSNVVTLRWAIALSVALLFVLGNMEAAQQTTEVGQSTEVEAQPAETTSGQLQEEGDDFWLWPFTALTGAIVLALLTLFVVRMARQRPNGVGRGIDELKPRVIIGGLVAVLLLYGFFLTLHYLLGMLPRNNTDADRIPGEYWLFIGQALGILGSLALNVATYYFGSSSSGEDASSDQKTQPVTPTGPGPGGPAEARNSAGDPAGAGDGVAGATRPSGSAS